MIAIGKKTAEQPEIVDGGHLFASSDPDDGAPIEWEEVSTEFTLRRAVTEIHGDTGTGRTRLALTAPGPIAYIGAAEKIDGLIQETRKRTVVRVHNFGGVFQGGVDDVKAQAMPVWSKFARAFFDSLGWARTTIVDTHTEAWELIRLAYFGGQTAEGGRVDRNYGPVNAMWRSLFKAARMQQRANVILIGQTKDEYIEQAEAAQVGAIAIKTDKKKSMGQRTGRTILAGQKEIPYFCDVVLRTAKVVVPGQDAPGFRAVIEKGWFHAEYEGTEFTNDDMQYPGILGFLTETPAKEWAE